MSAFNTEQLGQNQNWLYPDSLFSEFTLDAYSNFGVHIFKAKGIDSALSMLRLGLAAFLHLRYPYIINFPLLPLLSRGIKLCPVHLPFPLLTLSIDDLAVWCLPANLGSPFQGRFTSQQRGSFTLSPLQMLSVVAIA